MTDTELLANWSLYLAIAGVIVAIAAGLLIGIWLTARRILKLALIALEVVERIKANTQSIWSLQETNQKATEVLAEAESIRDHGALVAGALESQDESNAA